MLTLKLQELPSLRNRITLLRIRSVDPQVYVCEIEAAGRTYRISDNNGTATFRSHNDAKKSFVNLGIQRTILYHRSSYDEMIGLPEGEGSDIEVSVQNPDDAMS